MAGIENLKLVALTLINVGEELEEKLADGKISIWEAISVAGKNSKNAIEIFNKGKEIAAEFKDLDANEREDLIAYIQSELDLDNDKVEGIIEKAFDLAESAADFIDAIKALKAE